MKQLICFLSILILLAASVCSVSAEENLQKELLEDTTKIVEQSGAMNFDFSQTAQDVAEGKWEWSLQSVMAKLADAFFKELSENISVLVKIVVIAVLAGVICNVQGSFNGEGIGDVSFLACFIIIAGLSVSIFSNIIQTASETIDTLMIFMQSLLPALSGIIAASGGMTGAAVSPALFMAMQFITYAAKNLFFPLILVITALSVINNITGRFPITRLIQFGKQALKWGTGILMTIFVGLLSLQGFSSAFIDGVAGKTVKYAVGNFVPMVGNVLSDSVEAVFSSTVVIKNAVGTAGVIALVSICIGPLLKLLAIGVLYRFAAGVTEPATDKRIVTLISELGGNITQIFVILLMVCVMFIISVAMLLLMTNIPVMVS